MRFAHSGVQFVLLVPRKMVEYSCLWMPVLGCLEKSLLVEVIDPHSVKTCFFTIKKMWITSWLPILQVEMNLTSSCQNVQEVNVLDFWNAGEEFESDEDDDNDSDVEV